MYAKIWSICCSSKCLLICVSVAAAFAFPLHLVAEGPEQDSDAAYTIVVSPSGTDIRDHDGSGGDPMFIPDRYLLRGKEGQFYMLERSHWNFSMSRPMIRGNEVVRTKVERDDLALHDVSVKYSRSWGCDYLCRTNIWKYGGQAGEIQAVIEHLYNKRPDMSKEYDNRGKLFPVFANGSFFSVLMEAKGYGGYIHGWSHYKPTTVDLATCTPITFKSLFNEGEWTENREAIIEHIFAHCTKASPLEQGRWEADSLQRKLREGLGKRRFLLTRNREGISINLFFNRYEINPGSAGGTLISLPVSQMPEDIKNDLDPSLLQSNSSLPALAHLDYPVWQTRMRGVRGAPCEETEDSLPIRNMLVAAFSVEETEREVIDLWLNDRKISDD